MKITLVKKIKADGSPCQKCADVIARIERDGHMKRIDRIAVADERDPSSEGLKLAQEHGVDLAPFFIVEEEGKPTRIYTIYSKLVREVLEAQASEAEEDKDILRGSGVDFL
jgi:hypothetical protein